jgi:hypothetical protein
MALSTILCGYKKFSDTQSICKMDLGSYNRFVASVFAVVTGMEVLFEETRDMICLDNTPCFQIWTIAV